MKRNQLSLKRVSPSLKAPSPELDAMLITKPPTKDSPIRRSVKRSESAPKQTASKLPKLESKESSNRPETNPKGVLTLAARPLTEAQRFEKISREMLSIRDPEFIEYLRSIQKGGPPEKPTRFYKTKYRIPKTKGNTNELQKVLCAFINRNKIKTANVEVCHLPEYEKSAPFLLGTLDFVDKIVADNQIIEEKFGFESKNLRRNKMLLEEVLLTRLEKRKNRPVKPNFNMLPPKIKGNIN